MTDIPRKPPSGREPDGYAEILVRVWTFKDGSGEVQIETAPDLPFGYLMLGCEHMIRATAEKSGAGYEKAIDLLVDGALEGRTVRRRHDPEVHGEDPPGKV